MICRLLPHQIGDGPSQMALDEALLESVDAEPTAAVLRTYGWSAPTLSLGYFQALAEAGADPRWRAVPMVRRPSGGGAIWHDREITYALVVPRAHPSAGRASELYRSVHDAIAQGLVGLGIAARRRDGVRPASRPRPFLCFADSDPEDLVVADAKVVGSAQRRRPRAILQHGSLLLEQSSVTPEFPGLRELSGVVAGPASWAERLATWLPRALGLTPEDGSVRAGEAERSESLERTVYRVGAWLRRR